MLILLPPSEGKAAPRRGAPLRPESWHAALAEPRDRVVDALERLCLGDLDVAMTTLGVGPTQADDVRRNARLRELPTAPAERIYAGVLYDALGLDSFHLVGFSMGAMTALQFAVRHTDRLRTLVVIGITPHREPRASVGITPTRTSPKAWSVSWRYRRWPSARRTAAIA